MEVFGKPLLVALAHIFWCACGQFDWSKLNHIEQTSGERIEIPNIFWGAVGWIHFAFESNKSEEHTCFCILTNNGPKPRTTISNTSKKRRCKTKREQTNLEWVSPEGMLSINVNALLKSVFGAFAMQPWPKNKPCQLNRLKHTEQVKVKLHNVVDARRCWFTRSIVSLAGTPFFPWEDCHVTGLHDVLGTISGHRDLWWPLSCWSSSIESGYTTLKYTYADVCRWYPMEGAPTPAWMISPQGERWNCMYTWWHDTAVL